MIVSKFIFYNPKIQDLTFKCTPRPQIQLSVCKITEIYFKNKKACYLWKFCYPNVNAKQTIRFTSAELKQAAEKLFRAESTPHLGLLIREKTQKEKTKTKIETQKKNYWNEIAFLFSRRIYKRQVVFTVIFTFLFSHFRD